MARRPSSSGSLDSPPTASRPPRSHCCPRPRCLRADCYHRQRDIMSDDGARGPDDTGLRVTLLQHELDEAQRENARSHTSLLEPPYSQLRSVIRQYPQVSKTAIKALNVVTGTGRINFHRRALGRVQLPRELRIMESSGLFD